MRADRMLLCRYAVNFRALVSNVLPLAHGMGHAIAPLSMWSGEQDVEKQRAEWFPWCLCCGRSVKLDLAATRATGEMLRWRCPRTGHWLGEDEKLPDPSELPALRQLLDRELRAGGLDPDELLPNLAGET